MNPYTDPTGNEIDLSDYNDKVDLWPTAIEIESENPDFFSPRDGQPSGIDTGDNNE